MTEPNNPPVELNEAAQAALAEKYLAEAEEARQRARKESAVADKEAAWAMAAQAKAERDSLEDRKYVLHNTEALEIIEAKDKRHHKYQFCYPVGNSSVNECIDMLNVWHRKEPKCDMEIVFYSPGGDVLAGMRLFDHIRWLIGEGHDITTTAMGYAASMGGILLQAGVTRRIGREAYVLIHELSFGAIGDMGDVEDTVKMAKMIQKRVMAIFCERAKATGRSGYLTPARMKRSWTRKDWWLDSDECYKLGIVDEVI